MRFSLWPGRQREDELEEELQSHLQMAERGRMQRGETAEQAHTTARRDFGNFGLVKEATRAMWGWIWVEQLGQDLRYALRMLGRNPGFTAVAVLSLALGIGSNTAIFSVIDTLMLKTLPVQRPEQLVNFREHLPAGRVIDLFAYESPRYKGGLLRPWNGVPLIFRISLSSRRAARDGDNERGPVRAGACGPFGVQIGSAALTAVYCSLEIGGLTKAFTRFPRFPDHLVFDVR